MFLTLRKLIYIALLNMSLFILLIIGIQNSAKKMKVNILISETIELPVSFTIGSSFIIGSILGSIVPLDNLLEKSKKFKEKSTDFR